MLKTLSVSTETLGIINPMNKVYALTRKLDAMPYFFAIYTLHGMQHMRYDPYLCSMMRKNQHSAELDGPHFIVGLITIFKQFHPENYKTYILLMSHFFKNVMFMQTQITPTPKQLPNEGYMTLAFLEELIKFEG